MAYPGAKGVPVRLADVRRMALVITSALLLLLTIGCVPVEVPVGSARPVGGESPATAIEREVHERINAHRASRGLLPLQADATLTALARDHSVLMAAGQRGFGHSGFDERVEAIRAARPVSTVSENVATNNYPPAQVAGRAVSGWLTSPGHRENLEGGFDLTGVGVARGRAGDYFVTQIYAARRSR